MSFNYRILKYKTNVDHLVIEIQLLVLFNLPQIFIFLSSYEHLCYNMMSLGYIRDFLIFCIVFEVLNFKTLYYERRLRCTTRIFMRKKINIYKTIVVFCCLHEYVCYVIELLNI